ncbi:GNAT family N-acetyltransferase [Mesorhizobium sp. CGMCC 1.15528]|uniref:GNAT family N-acetyltransferase n=1 Tax=Mesorhizobium zhangyense TaxID=1776730 RepID=A0A7C9RAT9_9HYPH|nr:GNAT family N-acetyltransferase [Mesorhizobium zhangyense]NGN43959.1 GNAT family N-acetyltransferase [Mesorhizobium zhangyense]
MSDGRINVRRARAGDTVALKEILRDTFENTWLPHITPASAERYVHSDIGGHYVDEHGQDFAVAEIDGKLAGLVHWQDDFIEALHVSTQYQGRGVGRNLLDHAEAMIRSAGFPQARLETDTFNEQAQAVYKARGYEEKGRYPDDEWDSGFTTVLFVKQFA